MTTVTVTESGNTVTIASPGPKGDTGPAGVDAPTPLNYGANIGAGGGCYFIPGAQMSGIYNGVTSSNRYYGSYIVCETVTTLTEASVEVATGSAISGSVLRIGIYELDLDNAIEATITWYLLNDIGTIDTELAGIKAIDLSSSPIVLQPGIYGVMTTTDQQVTLSCNRVLWTRPIPGTFSHQSSGNRCYAQPRNTNVGATDAVNGMPASMGMTGSANMGGGTLGLGAWVIWKGSETLSQGYTNPV